ncbi:MAG TPA: FecR domain-containing protein [Opitutaceae bacterium]|nr:FecR domain-containing protein [Opitutaceae bacterium]
MTSPHSSPLPGDEEAASLWAVKLEAGPLSSAELRDFETWLAAATGRRELVADYCEFAADVGHLLPLVATADRLSAAASPTTTPRRSRGRLAAWALGGLVASAAAIAVFFASGPTPASTAPQHFATPAAQRHSFTLADGTRIDLSARTQVTVTFDESARRVQLAGGLAFFSVAKDPGKPFTVDTPAGSVLVTGTKFAVRAEPGSGLEVVVAEGQVQISPTAAAPVALGAGQQLSAHGASVSIAALSSETLADTLAWREGRIVFAATPLAEALAGFSRYHDRPIAVSAEAGQLRVGGRYSLDDLDGFLAAVEEILPVQITRPASGPVQVGLRAAK